VTDDPIRRAAHAQRLLDDELMRECREHMRESLTRAMWRRSALAPDEQQRLDAYTRHFGDFFGWLERVVADGRVAEADIREKSKVRQFVERAKQRI
jgi:hypothetical protein